MNEPKWVNSKELCALVGCPESRIMKLRRANLITYKSVGRLFYYDANEAARIRELIAEIKKQRKPSVKPMKHRVQAICPRCGRRHLSTRMWTGKGTPRLYCPKCEHMTASLSSSWQNLESLYNLF